MTQIKRTQNTASDKGFTLSATLTTIFMSPHLRGRGHVDFDADPVAVSICVGIGISITLFCQHNIL